MELLRIAVCEKIKRIDKMIGIYGKMKGLEKEKKEYENLDYRLMHEMLWRSGLENKFVLKQE